MNLQELIDSIFYDKSLKIKGEPLGKVNQFYPGATSEEDPAYITHRPINYYSSRLQQPIENKNNLKEQEGEENKNSDPTGGDIGNIGGGNEEEEEFDTSEIGRIYELKKIFSRLISLENFLSAANDDLLLKLASYVDQAIDLFKLVIDNVDQFLDQIDDIIVSFYEFLEISYKLLKKRLEQDQEGDK